MIYRFCAIALLTFTFAAELLAQDTVGDPIAVKDFSLPSADGTTIRLLDDQTEFQVVCFLGTECPLAKIYGPRLQEMADRFGKRVRFVGVNSNVQDSMDDIKSYAEIHKIQFPIVKDYDRLVALNMKATRTPEVIVIDQDKKICYRGRIDDQYQPGIVRAKPTRRELYDALQQLTSNKTVSTPVTQPAGCLIAMPKKNVTDSPTVTYCAQVSRVLQKHCIECHRSGEIGPFALDDYDEVVGWADMMVEVIDQNRMPPWHASSEHGEFVNARQMPETDKQLIRDWVDQGAPFGDASALPKPIHFQSGWRLPSEPDAIIEMNQEGFKVPADGIVEYQYFVVDPKFTEDQWVSAAQVIPGNAAVVHHCIAFIRPPDGADFRDFGVLAGYVPGQVGTELPAGYARRIPAGAKIVFQMHYTPTGKAEADRTKIGLVFADKESVTHEVMALVGIEQNFEIPPNRDGYTVKGDLGWRPADGELLSMAPHMHLRGKSFRVIAQRDSKDEVILDVPHYDFNWQHNYDLKSPIKLNSLKGVQFEATFDNSSDNPTNPEPNEYVTWGDQTWQEMAVIFFTVARPLAQPKQHNLSSVSSDEIRKAVETAVEQKRNQAREFAKAYIKRLDKNGDNQLSDHELPKSVKMFGYFDSNRDKVISEDEVAAQWLYRH